MTKVALAYSGSLDSTLCVHWLKEHHNFKVIALSVDVGIKADLVSLGDRAIQAGANSAHILDLRESFCQNYILPSLKAHLQEPNGDPLATAIGRPVICKALVQLAREHGSNVVAHGCKLESNDNIRFENELHALDSKLEVINPIRHWHFKSRDEKIRYARTHQLPIDVTPKSAEWSLDGNLWGLATSTDNLHDTWVPSPTSSFLTVSPIEKTPQDPIQLIIDFKNGIPTSLNGEKFNILQLMQKVNEIGSTHGIGHHDIIYHKLNGMKSRKIVESPGTTILINAHRALEEITLDNETLNFKNIASTQYRRLVSQGLWFSHLKESLDHLFESTQQWVTGSVNLELHRGSLRILGRKSPYNLYKATSSGGPSGQWVRSSLEKKRSTRY